MSLPSVKAEYLDLDYQLHIRAGLTPTRGEDGEVDWVGDDQAWNKYEELVDDIANS
jgi:hypothetical protein